MTGMIRRWAWAAADLAMQALAIFALAGVVLGLVRPGLNPNWVWVDLSAMPSWLEAAALVAFAAGVLGRRWLGRRARRAAGGLALVVALACLVDAGQYYCLVWTGVIRTSLPLPLSLPVALVSAGWGLRVVLVEIDARPHALWRRLVALPGAALAGLAILALQIICFGATDYGRPADAIVVLGAKVNADGSPSQALYDRTRTACLLYHKGLAGRLVMSGGQGSDEPVCETRVMRQIALDMGVPDEAIILDGEGRSTRATIRSTARLAERHGWRRVLAVSHDYHLSRIHLLARRAGLEVYTVPAEETRPLLAKPQFVQRELAAWLWYCFGPLASS